MTKQDKLIAGLVSLLIVLAALFVLTAVTKGVDIIVYNGFWNIFTAGEKLYTIVNYLVVPVRVAGLVAAIDYCTVAMLRNEKQNKKESTKMIAE